MNAWMHLANVAFLASFLARDVLWLRVACMAGAALLIAGFASADPVAWTAVAWQAAFFAIHGAWVVQLLRERRPIPLTEDERFVGDHVLVGLAANEVALLCRAGRWRDGPAGTPFLSQGERVAALRLLRTGEAAVARGGVEVARLGPGRFVGEVAWIRGEPASATVSAASEARWLEWPVAELRGFLAGRPQVAAALERALGADLAGKLASPDGGRPPG